MEPLIITSPFSTRHDTSHGHPECADRIKALGPLFDKYECISGPAAEVETIALAHEEDYIFELMEKTPDHGYAAIDGDTVLCPDSYDAACHAVGAACLGVDKLMSGDNKSVFCATRPPGHHAEPAQAMGFCFFNNIFIAARYAQEKYGVKKIAIVDFDVHHGNGTEVMSQSHNLIQTERPILYISSHSHPLFPMTGNPADNSDTLLNVTFAEGTNSDTFRKGYTDQVFPKLKDFEPELLMISAGFDAHQNDPVGNLNLKTEDFEWVTQELCNAVSCPILSILEGGYDIDTLKKCVEVHLNSL